MFTQNGRLVAGLVGIAAAIAIPAGVAFADEFDVDPRPTTVVQVNGTAPLPQAGSLPEIVKQPVRNPAPTASCDLTSFGGAWAIPSCP